MMCVLGTFPSATLLDTAIASAEQLEEFQHVDAGTNLFYVNEEDRPLENMPDCY